MHYVGWGSHWLRPKPHTLLYQYNIVVRHLYGNLWHYLADIQQHVVAGQYFISDVVRLHRHETFNTDTATWQYKAVGSKKWMQLSHVCCANARQRRQKHFCGCCRCERFAQTRLFKKKQDKTKKKSIIIISYILLSGIRLFGHIIVCSIRFF